MERTRKKRSLRYFIFIVVTLLGILPAVVLVSVFISSVENNTIDTRIYDIREQMLMLADHMYSEGYVEIPVEESINSEITQISNVFDGRVIVINTDLRIVKDSYSREEGKYYIDEDVINCLQAGVVTKYNASERNIKVCMPVGNYDGSTVSGALVVVSSTEGITREIGDKKRFMALLLVAAAVLVMGASTYITHVIVKPLRDIATGIDNIKEGFEERTIVATEYRETESVFAAFNHLIERMRNQDNIRQEFVANVSHELKTPITSVKVLAESLTQQEGVPVEMYKEFMQDIVHEIDREDAIINDLLSLVKMDKDGNNINVSVVDIEDMLDEIIRILHPIAMRDKVELIFDTVRSVQAEVDKTKLSLAITNVIENGIKYNTEGGYVKVTLDAEPLFFVITISDTGIGIPQEDIGNIFERFYRVDKSHSREIGGTGLGLAIVKNIVTMHKGAIKVDSEPGVGSIFTIKIPLSYIVEADTSINEQENQQQRS